MSTQISSLLSLRPSRASRIILSGVDSAFMQALFDIADFDTPVCVINHGDHVTKYEELAHTYTSLFDCSPDSFVTGFNYADGISGRWHEWKTTTHYKAEENITQSIEGLPGYPSDRWTSSLSEEEFTTTVSNMKDAMGRGEYFLANLTRTITRSELVDMLAVAFDSCVTHDCRFRFLHIDKDRAVLGLSPERFLQVHNGVALCEPIKGTSIDGQSLPTNSKEYEENTMMIDLVRSDLSRVCIPESIHVQERDTISSHPGLMHMSSSIAGTLQEEISIADAVASLMPIASVTGTPKPYVVKEIKKLEYKDRGIYCGAYGWVNNAKRECDLAVSIRVIEQNKDRVTIGAGAGITYHSDPQSEWDETELKLSRFVDLVERSTPVVAGAFTSLRVKSPDKAFCISAHIERVIRHASMTHGGYSLEDMTRKYKAFMSQNPLKDDHWIRMVVDGHVSSIEMLPCPAPVNNITVGLCISSNNYRVEQPKIPDRRAYATADFLAQQLSLKKIDHALLFRGGNIIESTRANIFFRKDHDIYTPALDNTMIHGVARATTIIGLRASGLTVIEKEISIEEMRFMDECVLINSVRGAQNVSVVTSQLIGDDISFSSDTTSLFDSINTLFDARFVTL